MLIEAVGRLCARARHIAYIDWHSLIPIGDGNLIFISFNPERDARHERAATWWGEAALDTETVDDQWESGTTAAHTTPNGALVWGWQSAHAPHTSLAGDTSELR